MVSGDRDTVDWRCARYAKARKEGAFRERAALERGTQHVRVDACVRVAASLHPSGGLGLGGADLSGLKRYEPILRELLQLAPNGLPSFTCLKSGPGA